MAHGPAFAIAARTNGTTRLTLEWDAGRHHDIGPEGHALKQFRRIGSDPAWTAPELIARNNDALKSDFQSCPSKAKFYPILLKNS